MYSSLETVITGKNECVSDQFKYLWLTTKVINA